MPKPAKAATTTTADAKEKEPVARLDNERAISQLVAAAIELLAVEGPTAIKVRAAAEAARLSTIAAYHQPAGLPELPAALVDQGFRDLGDALLQVPAIEDPATALFAMALASRRFARANPHLYDLMFGLSTRGSYRALPSPESAAQGRIDNFQLAYSHLANACGRLVASGRVSAPQDSEAVAPQLWSAVHGMVTLELGGHLSTFDDPVRQVLLPMMTNILVGLGDDRDSATASHQAALDLLPPDRP
jgi:AcrR family transcriptional regulator